MEIRGADALIKALNKRADLDLVKKTIQLNGSEMHRSAQRYAPVDTGELKRNVKLYMEDDGMTARVKSEAKYAPYQEYGTRYQSGKPHIRPAFNGQRGKFKNDISRLMK